MSFVRYYDRIPSEDTIRQIESIVVVDLTPPPPIAGPGMGDVGYVAEFLDGGFTPRRITNGGDLTTIYGGYSSLVGESSSTYARKRSLSGTPLVDYEGNGYLQLYRTQFAGLIICRVDTRIAPTTGERGDLLTITVTADRTGLDDLVIPAGTRFTNDITTPIHVCMTASAVTIPGDVDYSASTGTFKVGLIRIAGTPGSSALIVGGLDVVLIADVVGDVATVFNSTTGVPNAGYAIAHLAFDDSTYDLDVRYQDAIDLMAAPTDPTADIDVIWAGRSDCGAATGGVNERYSPSQKLFNALVQHAEDCAGMDLPRVALLWPPSVKSMLALALITAKVDAKTYVYDDTEKLSVNATFGAVDEAFRSERAAFLFPGIRRYISDENIGASIDLPAARACSEVMSLGEPEDNYGRQTSVTSEYGLEEYAPVLTIDDYILFKKYGIGAPVVPKGANLEFQSGVTTSTTAGRKNMHRTRMKDYLIQGINSRLRLYRKKHITGKRKTEMLADIESWLKSLRGDNNPDQQRIYDFALSTKMNSRSNESKGIFYIGLTVILLSTFEEIVLLAKIGEEVTIEETA